MNPPSDLLILRGLNQSTTEPSIHACIAAVFDPEGVEYIRIVRDKHTGKSKGFALVKMVSIEAAQYLIDTVPKLWVEGQMCWIEFGVEPHPDDWTCRSCSSTNFHWRLNCYKCSKAKDRDGKPANVGRPLVNNGQEDVCLPTVPSRFLLIRGIDSSLEGKQIYEQFQSATESSFVRIWMARDTQTYQSRGFAFVEFETPAMAKAVLDHCEERMPEGWSLSMGRDLYGLNKIFLKHEDGMLQYWDPLVCLVPYPEPNRVAREEQRVEEQDFPVIAQVVGAMPRSSGPPKTIKMQFKQWDQRTAELQSGPAPFLMNRPAFVPSTSPKQHFEFADYVRMMCLLCFRQFKTSADLDKHIAKSELHKANLESYMNLAESGNEYRNRAEERRQVDPDDSLTGPVKRQSGTEKPIGFDNVGAKLLKKMGWKEGEGLGTDSTGIKEPIRASGRIKKSTTGIGADKR